MLQPQEDMKNMYSGHTDTTSSLNMQTSKKEKKRERPRQLSVPPPELLHTHTDGSIKVRGRKVNG